MRSMRVAVILAATGLWIACSDSNGPAPTIIGTWQFAQPISRNFSSTARAKAAPSPGSVLLPISSRRISERTVAVSIIDLMAKTCAENVLR